MAMRSMRFQKIDPWRGEKDPAKRGKPVLLRVVLVPTAEDLYSFIDGKPPEGMVGPAVFQHGICANGSERGQIVFCHDYLREEYIGHEALHAALWVLTQNDPKWRLKYKRIGGTASEEQLAMIVGRIVEQIARFMTRIYTELQEKATADLAKPRPTEQIPKLQPLVTVDWQSLVGRYVYVYAKVIDRTTPAPKALVAVRVRSYSEDWKELYVEWPGEDRTAIVNKGLPAPQYTVHVNGKNERWVPVSSLRGKIFEPVPVTEPKGKGKK